MRDEASFERESFDRADEAHGIDHEGRIYEDSLCTEDDILGVLDDVTAELVTAIRNRDEMLIGTIVLAARDAYADRVHMRNQLGDVAGMPTERQAASLAIVRYYAGVTA
jgi:hypothetical protein